MEYSELLKKYNSLLKENDELKKENIDLRNQLKLPLRQFYGQIELNKDNEVICEQKGINNNSINTDKINLFMSLFKGRADVYAKRWQSKEGKSEYSINMADDPDVIEPLKFLREREVVHYQKLGEALRGVQDYLHEPHLFIMPNPDFMKK